MIELLSIDLSNYCSKQCSFCYNHSHKEGNTMWKPEEVVSFATDCINHGIKAISLGGGEPFEYDGIFDVIECLYPKCYLSVTTNGLPLEKESMWGKLMTHKPDKVHVTIHQPQSSMEVQRVINLIKRFEGTNIKPGVNLLVGVDKVEYAKDVYRKLDEIIPAEQIIIIPQRFSNTPTAKQIAEVAGGKPFQSPSCILGCKRPEDFVSVSWDKQVNSCSYAPCKQKLEKLDYKGMVQALNNVQWKSCMNRS